MRHPLRALSVVLVLLLVTSGPALALSPEMVPVEGLAPVLLDSLLEMTLDNVMVGVMDAEPAAIGLSARILMGADGTRYLASGEVSGAIGKAIAYAMCFEDGAYRVRMHNLSNDYTLSEAALDALDPSERPIDFPLVPPVQPKDVLALLAAVQRHADAQGDDYIKRPSYEPTAFRQMGFDQPGSLERVDVLGENLDLMFYEAALDAKAMDEWDATLRGAVPEINAAQAEIDAITKKYGAANWFFAQQTPEWERLPEPDSTPMPTPTPLPSPLPTPTPTPVPSPTPDPDEPDGYVKRGEHVDAKIRLWSDENANNTRSEKEVLISKGEGDKLVERHISTVWEQRVDEHSCLASTRQVVTDKRRRTTFDEHTEYRDDGGTARYSGETENTSHYEYDDYTSDSRSHTTTSYTIEPDGTHNVRMEAYDLSNGGQKTELLFEVEGGPDGDDDALISHMKFSVKVNEQTEEGGEERQVFALSTSFDLRMRQTSLPEGEGSLKLLLELDDGAQVLDLGELTADQKKALDAELNTAMIIASGTMMATPGVAKLIADVQTAMTQMYMDMFDRYTAEDVQSDL